VRIQLTQVYSQKSTRTTLPRSMSAVSGAEFTQRSTLKADTSLAALAAPAAMATPRNTKDRLAFMLRWRSWRSRACASLDEPPSATSDTRRETRR
jgi:hypothetical protein